jgi:hypothetical protein
MSLLFMKPIYSINEHFFKFWSSKMAYILGFTCADGCIYKKTLSWELSNKYDSDKELLIKFNKVMNSNYPIKERHNSIRLRISNPSILKDIRSLGITENKSKTLSFPKIPDEFLPHFIRGVLDADGWISFRIRKREEFCVGFSSGSIEFMKDLVNKLNIFVKIERFNLRRRTKITKNKSFSNVYQLEFYSENAIKLIKFLYGNLREDDLYLKRKYERQLLARESFHKTNNVRHFGNKWLRLEKEKESKMNDLLRTFFKEGLIPKDMALKLGISLSTLYRWLDKSGVRTLERRGSEEWNRRIISSRNIKNG